MNSIDRESTEDSTAMCADEQRNFVQSERAQLRYCIAMSFAFAVTALPLVSSHEVETPFLNFATFVDVDGLHVQERVHEQARRDTQSGADVPGARRVGFRA